MNTVATQQVALDNSLVAPEKRLKIEKCNARIAFSKPQREETYQVTLEALKLSPCYPAFVITTELEKKKFRVDTEVFREIIQICLRILNQDFIAPPSEEELVTFIEELGYSSMCISRKTTRLDRLRESQALNLVGHQRFSSLQTYYDFETGKVPPRKARKYKKVASSLRKLSPVKEAEPAKKAKRVKRPAKKSTTTPTAGVVIRDTPGVSVSKKKPPAKADRSKGIEILSNVALSEAAKLKEATKRSQKDFHMLHASGSGDGVGSQPKVPDESEDKTIGTDEGTGTIPRVTDVPKYQSESDNESWGESEDDNDNDSEDDKDDNNDDVSKCDDDKADSDNDGSDAHDNERTDSDDDDENPTFTLKDYDEEEHEEEYESNNDYENMFEEEVDDLYKDVNVRSLGTEHEKERKDDAEMTEVDQNISQEYPYMQVIEDTHVTLTTSQKTDDSKQSSSVSSEFANQFLIMEKAPPSDHKVTSLMNIKMSHEVPSTQISSPFTKTATV
ncbi:hypothetical protein Tco_1479146, partial [Tanacetum coccineum]